MYNNDTASKSSIAIGSAAMVDCCVLYLVIGIKVPIVYLLSNLHFSAMKNTVCILLETYFAHLVAVWE